MSKEEISYVDKLGISSVSINTAKDIIKQNILNTMSCWDRGVDIERQTFHLIGDAGIGKTAICYQIAEELNFKIIVIKAPVLSRDDFVIPFPVKKRGSDMEKFKMIYSDFIPDENEKDGIIYVIDENQRGDASLQQLLWQIQNEYKIHLKKFPKKCFVIAIDNPDDSNYMMNNIEDAAGLRRMLHIHVDVSVKDFINYATKKKFHETVIEYIQAQPSRLYDHKSQKLGSVFSNPASYERVSNILLGFKKDEIEHNTNNIRILISGLLNTSMTRMFMEFLMDKSCIVTPKDLIFSYEKVENKIKEWVKSQNNAKIGEIIEGLITYLVTSMPVLDNKNRKNIIDFLCCIPIDTAALFITEIETLSRESKEFNYISSLHVACMKESKKYRKDFYDKAVTKTDKQI